MTPARADSVLILEQSIRHHSSNMIFTTKVLIFACSLTVVLSFPSDELPVLGGVKELKGDGLKTAENDLKFSLAKLAAGDGPYYEVKQVNSATYQTVSGSLTKVNADLVDKQNIEKNCNVGIWAQPWLENGYEVTLECAGQEKVVKKHGA